MELLFVGTASWLPEAGRETASFLVNKKYLVDTGWRAVLKLLEYNIDPLGVQSVIVTHFHQDHYLGLPPFLFYQGMRRQKSGVPLRLLGPAEHLERIVKSAQDLLQWDRFTELVIPLEVTSLHPGSSDTLDDLRLETTAARHVSGIGEFEPALSLKFTEQKTGRAVVLSGDTSFNPALADFARGAQVLVHDAAHSRGREAGETASRAGVEKLFLVHYSLQHGPQVLEEARSVFPESYLAEDGQMVVV